MLDLSGGISSRKLEGSKPLPCRDCQHQPVCRYMDEYEIAEMLPIYTYGEVRILGSINTGMSISFAISNSKEEFNHA